MDEINDEVFAVICAAISLFSESKNKAIDITKKIKKINMRRNGIRNVEQTSKNEKWTRNLI